MGRYVVTTAAAVEHCTSGFVPGRYVYSVVVVNLKEFVLLAEVPDPEKI